MKRLLTLTVALAACASFAATPLEEAKAAAERGDFKEAERIWTELAKAGDAKAQYNLAIIHYYGEETGLPTDDSEVRALLEKAVAQNIPEAQYHLALLLLDAKHGLNITALTSPGKKKRQKKSRTPPTSPAKATKPGWKAFPPIAKKPNTGTKKRTTWTPTIPSRPLVTSAPRKPHRQKNERQHPLAGLGSRTAKPRAGGADLRQRRL